MSNNPEKTFFSTVPISQPVIAPGAEDYDMGGFAWSNDYGIIIKMNRPDDPESDILKSLKKTRKIIN